MENLKDKTVDELETMYGLSRTTVRNIIKELNDRKISQFKHLEGKYVKITELDKTIPMYIHVDSVNLHTRDEQGYLHISGHGFRGEFEEYKDMNWFDWSWWQDMYILLSAIEDHKDDDMYTFDLITKEEFVSQFEEMIENLKLSFVEIVKFDEKENENELKQS